MENLVLLVLCHLIGDYVLQSDYIAKTKGENWYHLFVHAALYCVPFVSVFGLTWRIAFIFSTHMIIDPIKARYKKLSYFDDQWLHYLVLGMIDATL